MKEEELSVGSKAKLLCTPMAVRSETRKKPDLVLPVQNTRTHTASTHRVRVCVHRLRARAYTYILVQHIIYYVVLCCILCTYRILHCTGTSHMYIVGYLVRIQGTRTSTSYNYMHIFVHT